jgi:predicted Zn finger-like uncharacterized protein
MLVQCPKCKTTYKVSDEAVKGATPSFRCSRCKHTFELAAEPDSAAAVSSTVPGETGENPELAFTFEPGKRSEPGPAREDLQRESESPKHSAEPVHARADREPEETAANREDETSRPKATLSAPTVGDIAPAAASAQQEKQSLKSPSPARESNDNVVVIEPYRDQPVSVKPFLTLAILLVLLFAFVAAYQKNQPAAAQEWLRNIPFVGRSVIRNDHVKHGVLLKSVETKYQSLQGSREVVVLTGVAVNQNPVMIRNVQLAGQLYDHDGNAIERQTMWIGNAISTQIIRGMTAQDVADLQRLKPLKTFEIPSGDSVPFAIVFLRTGKPIKDARCEVVSAEGGA